MGADTRERIIEAAAQLFWRQGYTGTGVKQVVVEAGAPFASLYHFFPGGKEQLGVEVVRWSGRQYAAVVAGTLTGRGDPAKIVERSFAEAAKTLAATDYADACPIATVALEVSSSSDPMREACAEVFEIWIDGLRKWFETKGVPENESRDLALTFLMLLEGAFILCRASRTTAPLKTAGRVAAEEVRRATPTTASRGAPRGSRSGRAAR
jgi:AcrR family transcriptional regulator